MMSDLESEEDREGDTERICCLPSNEEMTVLTATQLLVQEQGEDDMKS